MIETLDNAKRLYDSMLLLADKADKEEDRKAIRAAARDAYAVVVYCLGPIIHHKTESPLLTPWEHYSKNSPYNN